MKLLTNLDQKHLYIYFLDVRSGGRKDDITVILSRVSTEKMQRGWKTFIQNYEKELIKNEAKHHPTSIHIQNGKQAEA